MCLLDTLALEVAHFLAAWSFFLALSRALLATWTSLSQLCLLDAVVFVSEAP